MKSLDKSVATVGEAWKESKYYAHAEQWTHIFWNPNTVFRKKFDRLDLSSALELACGHGRHAEQAADMCKKLTLMDIHENNISVCQDRLKKFNHIDYYINNGYDYRPIADGALTAIYCYDAMVHFSPDLVASYLRDAARVLAPGGMGLFHHSNYPAPLDRHYGQNPHARNHMTQQIFAVLAGDAGLTVEDSTQITWGNEPNLDCVTLVKRPASRRL